MSDLLSALVSSGPVPTLMLGTLVLTVLISLRRDLTTEVAVTWVTLAHAAWVAAGTIDLAGPLLTADALSRAGWLVVLLTAALLTPLLADLRRQRQPGGEALILLLIATTGACVLAGATHAATLFLGIELVSIALFGLVGYPLAARTHHRLAVEAAVKYVVASAAASAVLAMGLALVFAATGALTLNGMMTALATMASPLGWLGLALILAGLAFKLSLAPFHWWTADVYQGASTGVTATLATLAKLGVVLVLMRWLTGLDAPQLPGALPVVLSVLAGASMLVGNLLAVGSDQVKRVLAYSSIAHLGYLVVALTAAPGGFAAIAALVYLAAYAVTTVLAFTCVQLIERDASAGLGRLRVDDLAGLFWHSPGLAAALALALLSLAGIPLTAGFIAKFFALAAGWAAGAWGLVALLIVGSAVGLYYYLRMLIVMARPAHRSMPASHPPLLQLAMWISAALVVLMGLWPQALIRVVGVTAG